MNNWLINKYCFGGLVLAFLEISDGIVHLISHESDWRHAFSLLELLWFVVSAYVFFLSRKNYNSNHYSAFLYCGYYTLTLFLSLFYAEIQGKTGDFYLPAEFGYFVVMFGALYLWANYVSIKSKEKIARGPQNEDGIL